MASVLVVVGAIPISAGDQQIVDLLDGTDAASARSDTVETRDDADPPANFDAYDLIIVSESASSGTVNSNYGGLDTLAKPLWVLENGNFDEFRLASTTGNTTTVTAYLADGTHHVAAGETQGDSETFTSAGGAVGAQAGTAAIGAGADLVWAANADLNDWRIWGNDTGTDMTSGTAPARRLAWGWKDPAIAALTAIGKNVFLASAEWLLGEDTGGVSGTLAETEDDDTLSASGTFTPPEVTGTLAETEEDDSLAASGSLGYSGSLAETEDDDSLSASGSVVNNIGSLAETEDDDTLAADGHLAYSGSLAETEEDDSLSASGSVGGGVSGSLAESETDDTLSATGTLGYSGSLAETEESDTLSATGSFGEGFFGTLSETEENDTLDASGTSTPPEVTGTLEEIEEDDALSASGTSTGLVGSLAETEADDTLAGTGVLGYAGSLAETEEDDSLSASGTVVNAFTGTLAVTEEDDALSATGSVVGLTFWEKNPVGYIADGVAHTRTPVAYTPAAPDEPPPW